MNFPSRLSLLLVDIETTTLSCSGCREDGCHLGFRRRLGAKGSQGEFSAVTGEVTHLRRKGLSGKTAQAEHGAIM